MQSTRYLRSTVPSLAVGVGFGVAAYLGYVGTAWLRYLVIAGVRWRAPMVTGADHILTDLVREAAQPLTGSATRVRKSLQPLMSINKNRIVVAAVESESARADPAEQVRRNGALGDPWQSVG